MINNTLSTKKWAKPTVKTLRSEELKAKLLASACSWHNPYCTEFDGCWDYQICYRTFYK